MNERICPICKASFRKVKGHHCGAFCSPACRNHDYRIRKGISHKLEPSTLRARKLRNERIVRLRSDGYTLHEIAKRVKVTLQRVHQILKARQNDW